MTPRAARSLLAAAALTLASGASPTPVESQELPEHEHERHDLRPDPPPTVRQRPAVDPSGRLLHAVDAERLIDLICQLGEPARVAG